MYRWRLIIAALLSLGSASSYASLVTLNGTDVSFTFDSSQLGMFGTAHVLGDILYFTPTNFYAQAGYGGITQQTTSDRIQFTVSVTKPGMSFGSLSVQQRGDYILSGSGASVDASGRIVLADPSNAGLYSTQSIDPSVPLTTNNGQPVNWQESAAINLAGTGWSQMSSVQATVYSAVTASALGTSTAYIEQKFSGTDIVSAALLPVPLPGAIGLFASGLVASLAARRRRTSRNER